VLPPPPVVVIYTRFPLFATGFDKTKTDAPLRLLVIALAVHVVPECVRTTHDTLLLFDVFMNTTAHLSVTAS